MFQRIAVFWHWLTEPHPDPRRSGLHWTDDW